MEDKALTETWAWLDDDFKLDADAHLVISGSLWDDFAQDEVVVRSLFPSSSNASLDSESTPSAFCSEISDSTQSTMSWDNLRSRPLKRRRVLHGDELESLFQSYEESQDHESGRFWPVTNEESNSSVDDTATEPSAESWMVGCFSDSDTSETQILPPPRPSWSTRITLNSAASRSIMARVSGPGIAASYNKQMPNIPAGPSHHAAKTNAGKLQVKRSTEVKPAGSNNVVKPSSNPVLAYPFTLLKPSGLHGDVTLQDINKRIKMISPASSAPTRRPKPTTETSPSAGKPVLGLTRIHTEGRGTITIMRTRSC